MFKPGMLIAAIVSTSFFVSAKADDEENFETKIRPILAGTCFPCHGGKKTAAGLRVDSRDALLKGGERGPAIVAGKPEDSLVVQALKHTDKELAMPPGKNLGSEVAADFSRWIERGANWPKQRTGGFVSNAHWAFAPVRAIEPPADSSAAFNNPIDRFLQAKRVAKGLHPTQAADKRTLLRRITFDLTGLPPSIQEMQDFLADESSTAWSTVVDRLLASPRYGERWGRHWLDVARYSDTAGDNADYPVPEARLYRDYVIDAFNADLPYDQFVREQIAGDLLAKSSPKENYSRQVIATGFIALSRRYATGPEELWHLTLEDAIETTGSAFMGLTLRCARCHDHKFDPITKEDYYALYGIFASTRFPYAGSEEFQSKGINRQNFPPLVPPIEAAAKLKSHHELIEFLQSEINRYQESEIASQIREWTSSIGAIEKLASEIEAKKLPATVLREEQRKLQNLSRDAKRELDTKIAPLSSELRSLQRTGYPPELPSAFAIQEGEPKDQAVQLKGDPATLGEIVRRGVPKALEGTSPVHIPGDASGRLQLAEWLTRRDHPLTARVMVNRIWQHHFGKGLVTTPSNFGARGDEPSHPELLDWLTAKFVDSGWSIKAMHRLIVSSQAYQMAATSDEAAETIDPANRYYWRFDRRRLSAEEIRDTMLLLGDHLDLERPGVHPFPPITEWSWTQHNPFKSVFPSNHRSVYLMTQRLQRHPFLALFDGPDTNHSTDVRTASTVPLQALFLMNSKFVRKQSAGLATHLSNKSTSAHDRIALAHELCWGRPATPHEIEAAAAFIEKYQAKAMATGKSRAEAETDALTAFARVMLSANEFFFVD